MSAPVIAVFGATGAQGGSLARAILADPLRRFRVRAVTRRPNAPAARALAAAGADIEAADLDDPASVRRAMRGAHGAFCVTTYWEHCSPQKELAQARTMAASSRIADVAHVVWSTLEDTREFAPSGGDPPPAPTGRCRVPHFDGKGEANRAFVEGGVPATLLYTSFLWDNLFRSGMEPRRDDDGRLVLVLPMGDAKLPGIAAADVGPCALAIFARGAELVGKSIGIAGEHLSGAEMASALGRALGEPVRHASPARDDYAALAFPGSEELASMFEFMRGNEAAHRASRSVECARDLHPGLMDFGTWIGRHAARLPIPPAGARRIPA